MFYDPENDLCLFFPHALQNNMHSIIVREIGLGIKISCLIVLFKSDKTIQIFCILVQSIIERGILKSPIIILDLSVSSCSPTHPASCILVLSYYF